MFVREPIYARIVAHQRKRTKKKCYSLQISSKPRADAALLRGRVDRDEEEVGLQYGGVDVGGEEEVAAAAAANDILKAGLVDGEIEVGTVPRVDTRLVEVDDGDLDVGALQRDDRARRATLADA